MCKVWHCKDCGGDFLAPHYKKDMILHPELDGDWCEVFSETYCPECGSEFIEEVSACEACGSHPKVMGSDFCAECQKQIDKVIESVMPGLTELCEGNKEIALEMVWDYYDRKR